MVTHKTPGPVNNLSSMAFDVLLLSSALLSFSYGSVLFSSDLMPLLFRVVSHWLLLVFVKDLSKTCIRCVYHLNKMICIKVVREHKMCTRVV